MSECKCSQGEILGNGCAACNPEYWSEILTEDQPDEFIAPAFVSEYPIGLATMPLARKGTVTTVVAVSLGVHPRTTLAASARSTTTCITTRARTASLA
jgi:hypothetical protein